MNFFISGEPCEVIIDDRIPCVDGKPLFSFSAGNELWVMLLEKAWCKVFGSYLVVEGLFILLK